MTKTTTSDTNANLQVRVVLLQDQKGRIQYVLPVNHLLDLETLHQQSGRKLMPMQPAEIVNATNRQLLKHIDGAPGFFLLPSIFEMSVSLSDTCFVEIFTVEGTELQAIDVEALKQLLLDEEFRVQALSCCLAPEQYLPPTLDFEDDMDRVKNSLQNFTRKRIRQRLDETLEIPTLPRTAERIIKLRANPDASVSELTDIVEDDASLAAQVVSWASSPYYAAPGKIRSVQDAIVRVLGFEVVSNLAVGLALGKSLSLPGDTVAGITPYWLQSVYCSTAVEAISRQMSSRHRPSHGLVYLAGLLHNFGYLVLAHTFPPHFSRICRYVEANPAISHVAIEHLLIGITREQIGAQLMKLWRMPEEVSIALRFQHEPDYDGEHSIYAHLIFIALRLLRQQGIGDAPLEPVPESLYWRYGLEEAPVIEAIQMVVESNEVRMIADCFPD
ncbi:MAG: HDOD domain-containing protein, partial [Pseudomonadales bacterium]|nr:HDOD domain-containing protein [Pseudomonadales bacterium]